MKDNISIMVVDNDPEILKSAWRVLNPEGHFVEGVLSGKEAIHKIKQNNYDLVFTDLMLNGIDGITLITWIRQYRPAIGIVAITGTPLRKVIKEAHKLGIISHMMKPFTLEMLRDAANNAIEMIKGNASEIESEEYFQPAKLAGNASEIESEEYFQPAKLAEVDKVINKYRKMSSHAMRVLLHAQEILGYLPPMIQKRIALGMNMHLSEIRSIVSFYSCFRTKPKGIHAACYISGIEKAWNSVTWMTGKNALHAVNEFIK